MEIITNKHKYALEASTATLEVTIHGDVGGNSQVTEIEVKSDGGQFPLVEVEKTPTGFRLVILGTWESGELLAALAKVPNSWNSESVKHVE
jgi:hypothetical protein